MDNLVTMIVDLLRRGKEKEALGAGGPTAPAAPMMQMPRATAPLHNGMSPEQIAEMAERGR